MQAETRSQGLSALQICNTWLEIASSTAIRLFTQSSCENGSLYATYCDHATTYHKRCKANRWPRDDQVAHLYEVRLRKDHRGVNLISDALPFGKLWYGEPNAISNTIGYAKFYSRIT